MKVSIKELRKKTSTRPEFKLKCLSRVGIYFAWFFLWLGVPVNAVTFSWVFLKLAGIIMLSRGNYILSVTGLFLYNILAPILDNADGYMLRYRKETSSVGVFVEAIGHSLLIPLLYISLGTGLYLSSGEAIYAFIGFSTSVIFLLRGILNVKEFSDKTNAVTANLASKKSYSKFLKIKRITSEWLETEYPLSIMFIGILFNLPKEILLLYSSVVFLNFIIIFLGIGYSLVKYDGEKVKGE